MNILGPVNERTSAQYTATITDETGAVVPGSTLSAALLTFYDLKTKTIINSRNAQNVNQTNGVSISEAGVVTWVLTPADNPIVNVLSHQTQETHIGVFDFRWDAGASRVVHPFTVLVTDVGLVSS